MDNFITELKVALAKVDSFFEIEEVVFKHVLNLGCELMAEYLGQLDEKLHAEITGQYRNKGLVSRTIMTVMGPVNFKRHRYVGEGYALDKELELVANQAMSGYLQLLMAKVAQRTTMRNTADTINTLLNCGISVGAVEKAVHTLGPKLAAETRRLEEVVKRPKVPQHLTIEGDAFILKLKNKQRIEVHHFRTYEVENGKIVRQHDFLGLDLNRLRTRIQDFLERRYDLSNQTIFLGSDAGPGYDPQAMLGLVPAIAQGEFVIDRYHTLQKIAGTFGHQSPLTAKAQTCLRNLDYRGLQAVLDTYEGYELTADQLDDLRHLRNYLDRNWAYIPNPRQRGYQGWTRLGSVESSHRAWTYRMKRQGKSWTKHGLIAMVALIEARINGNLTASLKRILIQATQLPAEVLGEAAQKAFVNADFHIRDVFRKGPVQASCGAKQGRIYLDEATSRPLGQLVKNLRL